MASVYPPLIEAIGQVWLDLAWERSGDFLVRVGRNLEAGAT